jgi:hypothetical protein
MLIVGLDQIRQSADEPPRSGKFLLNETAVIFFPLAQEHKDIKLHGLSYEDDYRGNAVAGIFRLGIVDIRFHRDFSDERIRTIWSQLRSEPTLAFLKSWALFYQGRRIA